MMHRVGLVQMCSGGDFHENLDHSHEKIREASEMGLSLVAFPEVFLFIGSERQGKFDVAQSLDGPLVSTFQEYAQRYRISILLGSIYETVPDNPEQLYNTSILLDKQGEVAGVYRKIHLCDIDSPALRNIESRDIKAGEDTVVVDHEIGRIGMTICYDLRFPSLYQHLTAKGAQIIFVPSAFFLETGKNHWIPLLRARAIENQVYIAAPAQWGKHYGRRFSYGHTLLIDPWGTMIACASERTQIVSGEIDLDYLAKVRERMPVMEHRRPECYPSSN